MAQLDGHPGRATLGVAGVQHRALVGLWSSGAFGSTVEMAASQTCPCAELATAVDGDGWVRCLHGSGGLKIMLLVMFLIGLSGVIGIGSRGPGCVTRSATLPACMSPADCCKRLCGAS